jgi:hypothetical protein
MTRGNGLRRGLWEHGHGPRPSARPAVLLLLAGTVRP